MNDSYITLQPITNYVVENTDVLNRMQNSLYDIQAGTIIDNHHTPPITVDYNYTYDGFYTMFIIDNRVGVEKRLNNENGNTYIVNLFLSALGRLGGTANYYDVDNKIKSSKSLKPHILSTLIDRYDDYADDPDWFPAIVEYYKAYELDPDNASIKSGVFLNITRTTVQVDKDTFTKNLLDPKYKCSKKIALDNRIYDYDNAAELYNVVIRKKNKYVPRTWFLEDALVDNILKKNLIKYHPLDTYNLFKLTEMSKFVPYGVANEANIDNHELTYFAPFYISKKNVIEYDIKRLTDF